jgi:predicted NAD-dependent protein-ADP-ribosyltransferase YbiA (DUF1768 family)
MANKEKTTAIKEEDPFDVIFGYSNLLVAMSKPHPFLMEYPCSICWRNKSYPSAEHIFHVERFRNIPRIVEAVQQQLSSLTPKALRIYAYKNRHLEDPNWKYRDGPVLQKILEAKFQQNDNLRNILMEPKLERIEFATRNERRYGID